MSPRIFTALLLLLAFPVVSSAPLGRAAEVRGLARRDAVEELSALARHLGRSRRTAGQREWQRVSDLLSEAATLLRRHPERMPALHLALLDLLGLDADPSPKGEDGGPDRWRERIATLARHRMEADLRRSPAELGTWLATEVVASEDESLSRRLVAADLLRGRHIEGSRSALLDLVGTSEGELQAAVLGALAGWPDPHIHSLFLDRLGPEGQGLAVLREHLERLEDGLGQGSRERVRETAGRFLLTRDWRRAAQALTLLRSLEAERSVPVLIEGLRWWLDLGAEGQGSRRIEWDIVEELRRLSGRSLGPEPEGWSRWWEGILEGRFVLPGEPGDNPMTRTEAGFFGLNPRTDRVLFVIDRSGSMDGLFGTGASTRYDEAVRRLLRFLREAGPETRFAITLFNDDGDRWRSGLVPASESNLERARSWLNRQDRLGGTRLREGLRTGLRLDRDDALDLDRVEVDTVVVLCDGETEEGPGWVRPWLRDHNEKAQLVFHCVQIGREGDGALESLAAGTGGRYILVRR